LNALAPLAYVEEEVLETNDIVGVDEEAISVEKKLQIKIQVRMT